MKSALTILSILLLVATSFATDTSLLGQSDQTNTSPVFDQPVIDEFGPLHDPVLELQFNDGPISHLFGVAWDGDSYWTVNGGYAPFYLSRFDENGTFVSSTTISIDCRGIVFNPVDGLLYISSYSSDIYRVDDPYTDYATTLVGSDIMQNAQASFGMGWDGDVLYDHNQGTVEVQDFWTFDLLDTMTGFSYGLGHSGGECSIIADTDYLYTVNTSTMTLYVYSLNGDPVGSYAYSNGSYGGSLSIANYMIWIADDSNGGTGTYYGYNVRDWTDGPVQFNLYPTIPPSGGNVVYDAELVSDLNMTVTGLQYRTFVELPNGQMFGPLTTINFTHTPFMNVFYTGLTQNIPTDAPAGTYTFMGGIYRNGSLQLSDEFFFSKSGVSADNFVFNPDNWSGSTSFEIAGETQDVIPSDFTISDAYPNPFNAETRFSITLPEASNLTVSVYNLAGQKVATLADGLVGAGSHDLTLNGSALASGLYFIHASVPGKMNELRKITLLK